MVEIERLKAAEHPLVAAWLSDPSINRWLASRWQGREFEARHIGVLVASPATRLYLIRHRGEPAGLAALSDIDRVEGSAGLWYLLERAHRSKGVATAAVRKLALFAFEELGLLCLTAWVTSGNEASCRVLERVGFRRVGVLRRGSLLDGSHVDRLLFDLLPEDLAAVNGEDGDGS